MAKVKIKSKSFKLATFFVAIFVLFLFFTTSGFATNPPTLSVNSITLNGTGYRPDTTVYLTWDESQVFVPTQKTNSKGSFKINFLLPSGANSGQHTLRATVDGQSGPLLNIQLSPASPSPSPSPSPTPTACLNPPSGIVSWWPGDGNSNDIIGSNNGSLQNGAGFAQGKVGQAFIFDGLDDFVQASTNNLPAGNNNRTIEFWVNVNEFLDDSPNAGSSLEAFFAGYGAFGSGQVFATGTAGNVPYLTIWGPAIFGPSLLEDNWYHIATTNSGNNVSLFVNGNLVSNSSWEINTPSNTQFYMGRIPDPLGLIRRLNGPIDEVTVYNRALSESEIQSIYNVGADGKCKPSYQLLNDDFNGTTLNTNKWEIFPNGGNVNLSNGFVTLSAGSAMPFVRTINNPIPISGPFTIEFGIQYLSKAEGGNGVAISFAQQPNITPGWENTPLALWQDNVGFGLVGSGSYLLTISPSDFNYHVVKISYDGSKYEVKIDGASVYISPDTSRVGALWFGHPNYCCTSGWTSFKLDYIKVTTP